MARKYTYHDVKVFVNGDEYAITDRYFIELTCCRTAGWRLWDMRSQPPTLIGGEYDAGKFSIEINGKVICGKPRPKSAEERKDSTK